MKKIVIINFVLFFLFPILSFGQNENHRFDTMLVKALERNISHPYDFNKGMTGINIIEISKKDSVLSFKSVFKTDAKFEILNYEAIIKDINKRCNKLIQKPFKLIIPINFLFIDLDDVPISDKDKLNADKKLKKLKRRGKTISNISVYSIESIPIRKTY